MEKCTFQAYATNEQNLHVIDIHWPRANFYQFHVDFEIRYNTFGFAHIAISVCCWLFALCTLVVFCLVLLLNNSHHSSSYTPASTKFRGGILVSPCPSVCSSVDTTVSALYLQQYLSDPFYICSSYQVTSEGVSRVNFVSKLKVRNFGKFFKFVTLTLSSVDLISNMTQ